MRKNHILVNKHCTKSTFYAMSEHRGVTLIALIVTIIVLLILAGVTIANITGVDSTIDKAEHAKDENAIQAELEEIQSAIANASTKGIRHGNFSGSADVSSIRATLKSKNLIKENPDEVIDENKQEWTITGSKTGAKYIIDNAGEVFKYIDTGELKIGDIVNYNANIGEDGSGFSTPYTYNTDENLTGVSKPSTFSSNDSMIWKVLHINHKTGEIQLISANGTPKTLALFGSTGFINAEKILDDISSIYGHGKYAQKARSIKIEDIEIYSNFDKSTYVQSYSNTGYYGGTKAFYSGNNFLKEIKNRNGEVISYDTKLSIASNSSPIVMTANNYQYTATNYFTNEQAYNTLFLNTNNNYKNYWIASRCTSLGSKNCSFNIRCVNNNQINTYQLLFSYDGNGTYNYSMPVCPIVYLNKNVKLIYDNEKNIWNIS